MSYGIKVVNPDVNRVVLDGSNPLYVIPPIRIANRVVDLYPVQPRYDSSHPPFGTSNGTGSQWETYLQETFVSRQRFDLLLQYPLTSVEPPLIFLNQSLSGGGIWGVSASSMYSWMPNTVCTPIGVPGRWTGMSFDIRVSSYFDYESGPRKYYNYELARVKDLYRNPPNLSLKFILVGHGVRPVTSSYGMVVYDSSGRVVFNSDSNIAKAVGATSNWIYNGRSGGSGSYSERWSASASAPSASAYVLFSPFQQYRRYNGEVAKVGMTSATGRPARMIIGGRSGSPAHTPIIWIEPMRPVEYW